MTRLKYILQSLGYFKQHHLPIVLGIALSTAILLGALIIGDSVRFSLEQITCQRLGKTSLVVTSGERLFSQKLAKQIASQTGTEITSLLRTNGIGIIDGGRLRINHLAVWGIDANFSAFSNQSETVYLESNHVAINEKSASLMGLKVGDEFLLRLDNVNTFPANTPFVSEKESAVSLRVVVARILQSDELGNFNLQNIQSAPRNIFINLKWLNEQMQLDQKANVMLVSEGLSHQALIGAMQSNWQLEDLNLEIRVNKELNYTELVSDRVFIERSIEEFCVKNIPGAQPVFSYFINEFSIDERITPYSFVSTDTELAENQISVGKWLADDLDLKLNDTLTLSYFEIGPLRRLVNRDTSFVVVKLEEFSGKKADQNLMPIIPGLSDAGNCRDWKTGVPIDLKKIRAKDEAYWNLYKGSPKAFISLETAQKIWKNRFGQSTSIRFEGIRKAKLESLLHNGILLSMHGFEVKDKKNEGLVAASNGTDFRSLFVGLSFFVLFASFLLSFLLFQLYLGFRKAEIGTLSALGFTYFSIRKLFLTEGLILVFIGILIGIPFSIFYNQLILIAINSIWVDIVRTVILDIHIRLISIVLGSSIVFIISVVIIGFILRHFLKKELVNLQRKVVPAKKTKGKISFIIGMTLIGFSCIMLLYNGFKSDEIVPQSFFISGFILLPGLIFVFDFLTKYISIRWNFRSFSMRTFLIKRLVDERKRNLLIVSFLSIGIFLIASTGMNRKDLSSNAEAAASGTGGYDYFIETTLPVLFDVLSPEGKEELNIPDETAVVQFQVLAGDDASCLNLNKINRPRLIACDPSAFNQRSAFTFVSRTTELDVDHPWMTLEQTLEGGLIPAIADQTVIQWGLMKKIGDTLSYKTSEGKDIKLKLVGGLANSIFQGNVIIADRHFNQAFPVISGSNTFLIDVKDTSSVIPNLKEGFRVYGADILSCSDRLMAFYTVENTYLNIFLMLGSLGLLIGTLGLGILIFRITFEQIPEYAILLAVGFRKHTIRRLVISERIVLMIVSIFVGLIPAMVSALPTLISSVYSSIWIWLLSIAALVLVFGTTSTFLAISIAFRSNLIEALKND